MATNFPTGLDALTNPTSTDALNSPSHADQHANVNDAVEALEAKVGVDGSAVTTSLDYKIANGILPKLNVDSGVLVVDAVNNRVGVNVASPAVELDVVGSATVRAAATQDGIAVAGRAGGTSSYKSTLTPTTLTANRTLTLPDATGTVALTDLVPAGCIMQYAGSSAPTGWLLCDGSAVSRSTYASLFSVVSTTYGAGDGSTTFAVPNLKGKVPVGRDSSDTSFDVLGETGGAKTHTLTVSEMPSHSHTTTITAKAFTTAFDGLSGGTVNNNNQNYTSDSKGGDQAHNNLQPYIVLNYIIKT